MGVMINAFPACVVRGGPLNSAQRPHNHTGFLKILQLLRREFATSLICTALSPGASHHFLRSTAKE